VVSIDKPYTPHRFASVGHENNDTMLASVRNECLALAHTVLSSSFLLSSLELSDTKVYEPYIRFGFVDTTRPAETSRGFVQTRQILE